MILTEKEKLIIELKAKGKTVKEIARSLGTNRQYAQNQLNEIYKKTGTTNGASLIHWAWANNILSNVTL